MFWGPPRGNTPYTLLDLVPGPSQGDHPDDQALKWSEWNYLLPSDDVDRDYVLSGVKYGFKLFESDLSHVPEVETNTYSSRSQYFDLVEQQI